MFARVYSVLLVGLMLAGLLLSAGCGSKEVAPVDTNVVRKELMGKVWKCQQLFSREVSGDVVPTIEFLEDGTVRGTGSCNNYTGTYNLDGESVTFGPMATTKKACPGALGELEYTYFSFLSLITKLKVDGSELELYTDDKPDPMLFTSGSGGLFW
ncbi:META domain-containing protein [Pseudodesulfovibrio sp. zrk46]|uniref:META domain-containing protein n=1 Tax=Pseudodesulfovibrio sp. zrk46 TaxID=2725288 RepID=UPI001448CCBC|nr:META domain-containing protein [Pseudodesulfovibrio sp. zrk46]QJB55175.1 META domain-containing protein [Pseudodesulfovibrio sp. zrk46]